MREIKLGCAWPAEFFDKAVEEPATYWSPVLSTLTDVLRHTPNVQKLYTHAMPLDLNILASIVDLSDLHTFESSNGTSPIWETVVDLPRSLSVVNAHLRMSNEDSFSLWNLLILFPHILVLTICGSEYFFLPRPDIRARLPIFRTLRRLFLDWIDIEEVDSLCEWILACKASFGSLHLTHFKLQSMYGLTRDQTLGLLDALSTSPMDILVLEGISYVGGDVFQHIAQTFPDLKGLTLVYRQNDMQRRTDAAEWPYPSWALAAHLSVFSALKHFGCNFRVTPLEASPSMMIPLEENFAESGEWRQEDDFYFFDEYVVPRLWAVHCQTLETVALVARYSRGFRISRDGGRLRVAQAGEWFMDGDIAQYHPDGLLTRARRWPDIIPRP